MTGDPYRLLGVSRNDGEKAVHRAYVRLAKDTHPDRFSDTEAQQAAEKRMIEINLAYHQVLAALRSRPPVFTRLPLEQVIKQAAVLLDKGEVSGALRLLARADRKDASWYHLQGRLLMRLGQFDGAHQSFREAVRLSPDTNAYRAAALEAAVAVKKHNRPLRKALDGMKQLFVRPRSIK